MMKSSRKTEEEPKAADSTLVMFTSIMLILLTFFIMMVTKANFDETKYGKVRDSVVETFGIFTGGLVPMGVEVGLADGVNLNENSTRALSLDVEMAQIRALLAPEMSDGGARIVHNQGQRIITLDSGLLFDNDSIDLTEEARERLLAFCRIMAGTKVPITIEGHTDNQPPNIVGGGDNWDISVNRALTVLGLFIGEGGLSADRLTVYGYGGAKPMVANNSPANRAKNNRVDLVLDFEGTREGALRDLGPSEKSFDFQGFEFDLPEGPGREEDIY